MQKVSSSHLGNMRSKGQVADWDQCPPTSAAHGAARAQSGRVVKLKAASSCWRLCRLAWRAQAIGVVGREKHGLQGLFQQAAQSQQTCRLHWTAWQLLCLARAARTIAPQGLL